MRHHTDYPEQTHRILYHEHTSLGHPFYRIAIAALLVAATVFPLSFACASSRNLVGNGDFEGEVSSAGVPVGWLTYVPGASAIVKMDRDLAVEGKASVRLQTESDIKAILVSDPIPVAPGEKIHLRVWYRTIGLTTSMGGTLAFSAGFLDSQRHYFRWHRAPSQPGQPGKWHQLVTEAVVPTGAAYATFQIGLNRMTGTIWWDRAELVTESPAALRFDLYSSICNPGAQSLKLVLLNRETSWAGRPVTLSVQPGGWDRRFELPDRIEKQISASFSLQKRGSIWLEAALEDASTGEKLFSARYNVTVPPLLKIEPLVPTHWCAEDGQPQLEGRLWVYEFPDTRQELTLYCALKNAKEVIEKKHISQLPSDNPIHYKLEPSQAGIGDYRLDLVLKRDEQVIAEETLDWHVIHRRQARVELGTGGFLVVDGKPFLPIGMFNGGRFAEQTQAGFNVAHGYNSMATKPGQVPDNLRAKRFLDTADSLDMKTLMLITHGSHSRTVDDEFVRRVRMFRNHPGLLAWDEEEGVARGEMPLSNLARMREVLQQQDSHHPFMVGDGCKAIFNIKDRSELFPEDLMDMGMWWWYPFPLTDMKTGDALAGVDATTGQELVPPEFLTRAKTDKPIWVGLQAYRKPGRSDGRFPSPDEYRAQAYIALIHGAKGLMYYVGSGSGGNGILNKPDEGSWNYLKALVSELREMEPVFMSPDSEMEIRLEPNNALVSTRLKATESGKVLLAVNRSMAEIDVEIQLSGQKDCSASVQFENRVLKVQGGKLNDRFAPFAVHIYRFAE